MLAIVTTTCIGRQANRGQTSAGRLAAVLALFVLRDFHLEQQRSPLHFC